MTSAPRRLVRALPDPLRRGLRAAARWAAWAVRRLPRDPPVEIYSAWREGQNLRFFRKVNAEKAAGAERWLEPWRLHEIPRTIWIYWGQGGDAMPPVVQHCVQRWADANPGWTVHVLDRISAATHVSVDHIPAHFPQRIVADALRLRLLRDHGGVWADATVLCHVPLDRWLPMMARSGFFVFADGGPDRMLESWFIASERGHPLMVAWDGAFARHLARTRTPHEAYFHVFYVLQHRLLLDRRLRALWRMMPRVPAPPCFQLASHLEGLTPPEPVRALIAAGLQVSKLSWRAPHSRAALDAALHDIEKDARDARTAADGAENRQRSPRGGAPSDVA